MKKNELFHLHALLVRVAERLLNDGVIDDADLDPYAALGVSPVAVRAARDDHQRAVRTLAGTLAEAVEADRDAPVSGGRREADAEPPAP